MNKAKNAPLVWEMGENGLERCTGTFCQHCGKRTTFTSGKAPKPYRWVHKKTKKDMCEQREAREEEQ